MENVPQPGILKSDVLEDAFEQDRAELSGGARTVPIRGESEAAIAGVSEPAAPSPQSRDSSSLVDEGMAQKFRSHWDEIQGSFVDEPRRAVQQADDLVNQTIKGLTESFARERGKLEAQWDRGTEVSTEDLRQALQRYRSFFKRLLAA